MRSLEVIEQKAIVPDFANQTKNFTTTTVKTTGPVRAGFTTAVPTSLQGRSLSLISLARRYAGMFGMRFFCAPTSQI